MVPPTKEDLSKLHSEVNQYLNQRFSVTMTAITITGVALGWIIQQANAKQEMASAENLAIASTQDTVCFLAIILMAVLMMLFIVTCMIRRSIMVISTYLQATKASIWEQDHARFTQSQARVSWGGQEEVIVVIFAFLGLLATLTPIALNNLVGSMEWPKVVFCWTYFLCFSMCIYMGMLAFLFWLTPYKLEDRLKTGWRKLKMAAPGKELKVNQIWSCETCGLEIKIVKECDYSVDESKACEQYTCLPCWDKPLKLKS